MMKTNIFNVKSWDIFQDTALTSDIMNVMSTDISSWIALTKYLLWEHQQHITGHMEVDTQDQAEWPIRKIGKEGTALDHILDTAGIVDPIVTCT